MPYWLHTTGRNARRYGAALIAGFLGGNIASFVKWGAESPFPPRTADRAIPPKEMLDRIGFNSNGMVYHYSNHAVNYGVAGVHHLFSIVFALIYSCIAEVLPRITLWQGIAFGLGVTATFHGVILPLEGWAPPIWNLPADEIISEIFGHIVWMWTIEIFRRDIRNRITGEKDPAAEWDNATSH